MSLLRDNARLERRVLDLVGAVKSGTKVEDSLVELKTEWPAPEGAFRQLAGHANAARGDNILWVIGIDEKDRSVPGANGEELSVWWPQVQKRFESTSPDLIRHLNVQFEGVSVQALLFGTDRAPYVVHASVKPEAEVPWRDGTRTRSAKRHELLSLLEASTKAIATEIISGRLHYSPDDALSGTLTFIISETLEQRIVVPVRRCGCTVRQATKQWELDHSNIALRPYVHMARVPNPTVTHLGEAVAIDGTGLVTVNLRLATASQMIEEEPIEIDLILPILHLQDPLKLHAVGTHDPYNAASGSHWTLREK